MKRTLILVNLGSPESPAPEAVGTYLKEFLMDPFVIDIPKPLRWFLVNVLIVPKRKFASAHAYEKIWGPQGSPLVVNTEKFVEKLKSHKPDWDIHLAMRYGSRSLKSVLEKVLTGTNDLVEVVPLYPQWAKSSTGTCEDVVEKVAKKLHSRDRIKVLKDFYDDPEFAAALGKKLAQTREEFKPDAILFSYHGLPEHHVTEFDLSGEHCLKKQNCCDKVESVNRFCYRAQCFQTSKALAKAAGLNSSDYQVSFQSRLGSRPWIKPYTDLVLKDLAAQGKKRLLISCPSFVADCLETLEEIQIRAKEDFIALGGEDLKLVPAVNDSDEWVQGFARMMEKAQK